MTGRKALLFFVLLIGLNGNSFSQDATEPVETRVTLTSRVEPSQVPLNRTARLIVEVAWSGDIDLIEMGEIEEPVLTNLKIVGSSATNRVMATASGQKAVKEIVYILEPEILGMGYVESVALSYTDKATEKTHHLMTQRVGVEAVSAVSEPGEFRLSWIYFIILVALVAAVLWFVLFRKTPQPETEETDERLLEESVLEELKETVSLEATDRTAAFTMLSNLFRKYLIEKYGAPAAGWNAHLEAQNLDEGQVKRIADHFGKADVIKFSGQETSLAELQQDYTLVETFLESQRNAILEERRAAEEAGKKKKRKRK